MRPDEVEKCYGSQLENCDRSFDADFDRMIEVGHMRWKPWIGVDWNKAERRILVVGESHYAAKLDDENVQARVAEWETDAEGTREIVCEVGVEEWYASRFFGNLHRALLGTDVHGENRTTLWRHLAFCNFIQRPMRNPRERPSPDEFFGGWRHFVELLKRLRPNTVLFVGVSAANQFGGAMSALGIDHSMNVEAMRNGASPRDFSATFDGMSARMLAIRHVSQYFAWETWRDFLAQKLPEDVAYLRKVASVGDTAASAAQALEAPPATETSESAFTLKGMPMWLQHKPVVACDYQDINDALGTFDSDDARFISVGHAQYDANAASVKMFRMGESGRWSRQSEEVPVQRLPYMMAMLLAAIYRMQHPGETVPGDLGDVVVAPQDMDSLREQLQKCASPLKDGLSRVKTLLDNINLNRLLKDE